MMIFRSIVLALLLFAINPCLIGYSDPDYSDAGYTPAPDAYRGSTQDGGGQFYSPYTIEEKAKTPLQQGSTSAKPLTLKEALALEEPLALPSGNRRSDDIVKNPYLLQERLADGAIWQTSQDKIAQLIKQKNELSEKYDNEVKTTINWDSNKYGSLWDVQNSSKALSTRTQKAFDKFENDSYVRKSKLEKLQEDMARVDEEIKLQENAKQVRLSGPQTEVVGKLPSQQQQPLSSTASSSQAKSKSVGSRLFDKASSVVGKIFKSKDSNDENQQLKQQKAQAVHSQSFRKR